ncbi:MAG: TldD/PmbA family protein [Candidatus Promineifilaceae bacterium]|nr:TldD/PmbA family protein [Candidatus Promineifilaceae bacterium]
MMKKEQIEERLQRALALSPADETEVLYQAQDSALTRFARNGIHQNVAEANAQIMVRAVAGQRVGAASTNDLSDKGLAQTAERALAHAAQQPDDPDFPGLAAPQPVQPINASDEAVVSASPDERAAAVAHICSLATERELEAFGAFRTGLWTIAVANSHGVMCHHRRTLADLQATVSGEDGSGRAQVSSWRLDEIDADTVGREAVEKAVLAQQPRPLEPETMPVVLDPYATMDIVVGLALSGGGALAVQEGRSWMIGRQGQKVMNSLVSIWDDGRDPAGAPLPFDFEGVPKQRVDLVHQGIVGQPVYDRYTAGKADRTSTGHAMPPGHFISGPSPINLFMAPGGSTVDELIAEVNRGLYVTRFWYTRLVQPRDCLITGMTRDGTYLIEDGRLAGPVKDLRFTQSYVKALATVEAVGKVTKTLINEFGFSINVPALLIGAFQFTGRTA